MYNIFVGSWNVNQKNPKQVDWKKWLSPPVTVPPQVVDSQEEEQEKVFAGMESTSMRHDEVDIYVISFQEVLTVDNVSPVFLTSISDSLVLFLSLFFFYSLLMLRRIQSLQRWRDLITGTPSLCNT